MEPIDIPQLPTYLFEPSLAGLISLVLTIGLPLLAAIFMKKKWDAGRKGLVLLALAAVKALIEAWLQAGDAFAFATFYAVLVNFLIAVAMHFGLLRGTWLQREAIKAGLKDRALPDDDAPEDASSGAKGLWRDERLR